MNSHRITLIPIVCLGALLLGTAPGRAADPSPRRCDPFGLLDELDACDSAGAQASALLSVEPVIEYESTLATASAIAGEDPLNPGHRSAFELLKVERGGLGAFAGAGTGHELRVNPEYMRGFGPEVGLLFKPRHDIRIFGRMDYQYLYDQRVLGGFESMTERPLTTYTVGVGFEF